MSPGLVSPRSSPFSTRGPGRSPAAAATPWFLYLRCPWPCVLCALIPGRTAERRHRTPQPRPAPAATVLTSRDWPASAPALRPTPSAPPRRPAPPATGWRFPEASGGGCCLLARSPVAQVQFRLPLRPSLSCSARAVEAGIAVAGLSVSLELSSSRFLGDCGCLEAGADRAPRGVGKGQVLPAVA